MQEVESLLRAQRPALDDDVERRLIQRIAPAISGRPRGLRLALASAATVVVFAALASFGGVSYAVTAAKDAVSGGSSGPSTFTNSSDGQYGEGSCVEYVNPHGQNIPPAGQTLPGNNPHAGQNDDGFYQIGSSTNGDVVVIDTATGHVFGPYPSGTVIKYTEANGAAPSEMKIGSTNGQAGAVYVHIQGQGDPAIEPVGSNTFTICYVPPKPK
jgi:hypothetical protein